MQLGGVLKVVRAVLLLGLLAAFSISLVTSLLRERPDLPVDPQGDRFDTDPGLRVLLAEASGNRSHTTVRVVPLQPSLLYCPDDPTGWVVALEAQQACELISQGKAGIAVDIPSLGRTETWEVERLALTPRDHTGPGDGQPIADLATIEATNAAPVFALVNGEHRHQYRGNLEISLDGAVGLFAVNALPIEAWLEGMLQAELTASWPEEALKAQAIAGRSYAFAAKWSPIAIGDGGNFYELSDAGRDPSYTGTGRGGPKIVRALAATHGQILTYFTRPFRAHFHAASGGRTASIEDLEPGAVTVEGELPLREVMVSQDDPWCQRGIDLLGYHASHGVRDVLIEASELRNALSRQGRESTWVHDITVTRHAGGRIAQVALKAIPPPDVTMTADEFRMMIGPDRLRSTLWSPESPESPDISAGGSVTTRTGYRIITAGWGHGVGLSQVSAYAMARDGRRASDILQFFYPDTRIEQRW